MVFGFDNPFRSRKHADANETAAKGSRERVAFDAAAGAARILRAEGEIEKLARKQQESADKARAPFIKGEEGQK